MGASHGGRPVQARRRGASVVARGGGGAVNGTDRAPSAPPAGLLALTQTPSIAQY